jgi:anti-sigma factor RsiW
MITRVFQSLRDAAWHPDDEQLVTFIDGELGQRESARVRRHLAHCWACRGRERRLTETIDAFMDAYAAHSFDDEDDEDEALLPHPARLPHAARAALREDTPAPAPLARVRERVREAAREALSRVARQMRVPQVRVPQVRVPRVHVPLATIVRLGAAFATALVIVLLTTGVPLSARQVVRHVDRAERGVLAMTHAPVIYQRLEIAVRQLPGGVTSRGMFDLWTDVERHRHHGGAVPRVGRALGASSVYASAAVRTIAVGASTTSAAAAATAADSEGARDDDDPLRDLLALFARRGLTSAWPVSLRSYEQVRAAANAVTERVLHEQTSDGEQLLTLETTAVDARDQSIDTRLVVRERDWHPIEQHLTVREGSATTEFVVRERGFEVVPLATLPVAFFDAPRLPESAAASAAPAVVEARRPVPPAASELVSAEVQAMFALHRVGLTAEDDIAVQRHDSTIDVSGLTTTDARRRQLMDAIASIKHVRVRIRTTDEALAELSGTAPAEFERPALRMDESTIEATRVPVHTLAEQSRPAERRPDEASMRRAREAVRQSLALLERAWALRRLAEWSRRTNASTVTASTRGLIDLMVREHADAASKALAALDTTVTPTLPTASRATPEGPDALPAIDPSRAWVDVATDFFGVVAEIDRDTRRLFTASPTPTTEAVEEARRLRHGLDRAARSLLELRQPTPQPPPLQPEPHLQP